MIQKEAVTIEWISDWAGGIIVAVVIGAVIEMILPEGNSKKYIKVVIGVYVLFTIVSPVITKFTGKTVQVSDILDLDKYIEETEESMKVQNTIQDSNQSSILEVYSSGIKDDMKAKIEAKGYKVNDIAIEVANDESYSITSIVVEVEEIDSESEEETNTQAEENNTSNKVEEVESVNKIEISITENDEDTNKTNTNSDENKENKNSLSSSKKKELKEYLSGVYEVQEENITIN